MLRSLLWFAVALCAVSDEYPLAWPQWGLDAMHSSYQYVEYTNEDREEWNYTAGERVVGSPAVAFGRVWFGDDTGTMRCVNATTGELIWSWMVNLAANDTDKNCTPNFAEHGFCKSKKIRSSPAVDEDGAVFFGAYDFSVYKLNMDGELVWKTDTKGVVYGPVTLAENTVYVGSFDNNVYAIHRSDGSVKWKYDLKAHGDAGWVLLNGVLLGASNEGGLCTAWPPPDVPNVSRSCIPPKDPSNATGLECGQCHALALDANTGYLIWNKSTGGPSGGGMGVREGTSAYGSSTYSFYVGDWSKTFSKYDAMSGKMLWSKKLDGSIESHPSQHDGVVFVSTENNSLYAIYTNGTEKWKNIDAKEELNSSPAIAADFVFFGSNDKMLHAVHRGTGKQLFTFETCANVFSSPAVDGDGIVYVGCNTVTGVSTKAGVGALYAINPTKHLPPTQFLI